MTAFKRTARGISSPNSTGFHTDNGGPKAALIGVPVVLLVVEIAVTLLFVYLHKKRVAAEKARSIAKSKLWLEKMPPPMIWKDIDDGLSETSKDACCCAICLEQFEAESEVRQIVGCTHVYHRQCFDQWVARKTLLETAVSCPLCRRMVGPSPDKSISITKPAPAHVVWV